MEIFALPVGPGVRIIAVATKYGGEQGSTEVMTSGLHAEVLCLLVNPMQAQFNCER